MKNISKIQKKMLVRVVSLTVVIFVISVGYISYKARSLALKDAEKLTLRAARENALKIEKDLSSNLEVLRTLAQAFGVYKNMPAEEWQSLFLQMYSLVYDENPEFYKLWDSWEMKYYDTVWQKDHGRLAFTLYRENGEIKKGRSVRSLDGDNEGYSRVKNQNCDFLWEPYWDIFLEGAEDKKFMTSISSPIRYDGHFAGVVAADITMEKFQEIVRRIKPYERTKSYLISNGGVIVGHQDSSAVGKSVSDYTLEYEEQFNISELIKNGKSGVFRGKNKQGESVMLGLYPIEVGELYVPWSIVLTIPVDVILKESNRVQIISLMVALLGIFILSVVIVLISRAISNPLNKTTEILKLFAKGDIEGVEDLEINTKDEIQEMANSVNILRKGLNKTSVFAEQIGQGDLDAEFEPLGEKDVLGNSLLRMRDSLLKAKKEDEKRKVEDKKQNWATEGLAKFGEILRENSSSKKELSFNIMSNLVNYLDVNQGALFVIEENLDGVPMLELQSTIAYGRDKFISRSIAIGEELVGRCAFEQKTIYMTDIPDNYISITSGMGTSNPSSLLLVPLVLNEQTYGVVELASFKEIEKYQIEFVERLGESIASTVSTVQVNEKTTDLLNKSREQAENLAAQEEEMRQNLEELQATQEEAARREMEMEGIIKALGESAFIVEYDLDGMVLNYNEKYANLLGISKNQAVGTKHSEGYVYNTERKANYDLFWGDLRRGMTKKEINKVNYNGKEVWIEETYTPMLHSKNDIPYKVLKRGFDISSQKEDAEKIRQKAEMVADFELKVEDYKSRIKELENLLKQKLEEKKTEVEPAEEQKPELIIPASGKNLIDWIPEFELDITEMDMQHKQLIELINTFYISVQDKKTKKETKDNLNSFADFAAYHFGSEETYFDDFNFSQAQEHIAEHKHFIEITSDFQKAYGTNKVKNIEQALKPIKEWLFVHFSQTDQKYKNLFKQNGL